MGTKYGMVLIGALFSMLISPSFQETQEIVLTDEEKEQIVSEHNAYRKTEGSSNMRYMEWDEDLAHGASLLAGSCVYGHGHTTWPGSPFGSVGQNLFMDTAAYSVSWPLRTWWYEKWNYDYNSGTCSFICGHYTQMAWAKTTKVGCAKYRCDVLQNSGTGWNDADYFVCNYAPAGNVQTQAPFLKGEECSRCESLCEDGLCKTNTQCNQPGANCVCGIECDNCGRTNNQCKCDCPPGFRGKYCHKECKDKYWYCGSSTGWPTYLCDMPDYQSTMHSECPVTCEICDAANDETELWCQEDYNPPGHEPYPPATTTTTTTTTTPAPTTTTQPTTTTKPFSIPACVANFTVSSQRRVRNGIAYRSMTTLESCLAECWITERCEAIDYCADRGTPCKLHMVPQQELTYSEGVDNYRLVRCSSTPGCDDQFRVTLNYKGTGAQGFLEAQEPEACADICRDTHNCQSFDFVTKEDPWQGIRCWVHTYDDMELVDHRCADHYYKIPCSSYQVCEPHFDALLNKYGEGGTPRPDISTFNVCGQLCQDDVTCTAFDWDRKSEPVDDCRCWHHFEVQPTLIGRGKINHHPKRPADPDC